MTGNQSTHTNREIAEKFPDLGGYCKYLGTREIELSEQPVTLVYTLGDHTAITVVACFYMDDVLD